MKDNILVLKDKNGDKKNYRILFDIENVEENINYVIYTDDKKDKNGETKAYVSSYILSDKGNMTKLKSLKKEDEFDFIEKILNSLQE